MQILGLGLVHPFIVDLWQTVEVFPQFLEIDAFFGISKRWQGIEVDILGMKGKDADATVGIRVGPGVGDGGVVDGQHLQHSLSRAGHPVDHLLQVAEVAHAETVFGAEREYRYQCAGTTDVVDGEEGRFEFIDHHAVFTHVGQRHPAVVMVFPYHLVFVSHIHGHELELQSVVHQERGVKVGHPLVVVVLIHGHTTLHVPVAQLVAFAHQHEAFVATELWGAHLEAHGSDMVAQRSQ